MKRFVLFFFIIVFYLHAFGQTNTWIGGVSGNWSLNTNWSQGHPPTSAEDVQIGITCNINVNSFTAGFRNINSLQITGTGITVTLSCTAAATRLLRMSSTSSATKGLAIEAGNTLIFDATNTTGTGTWICDLTGGNGVTGLIDGTLKFAGTGTATGAASLNVYTGPGANASLIVSSTGSIIYLPDSDNTNSTVGAYLTMQNGSTYEIAKNNGFFPEATWEPNSLCKASSPGTTVPGFVDGMTYGNLEWNCPAQLKSDLNVDVTFNNATFLNTNGQAFQVTGSVLGNHTMTINGNLEIQTGSYLDILGADAPTGSSGKIILKGDLIQTGGVLITNGLAGTTSKLELQGSSNQNISISSLQGVRLQFIMNGVSATLLTPVILPGDNNAGGANLQLVSGKIITTSANYIRLNDNATYSGGSSNSFVSGPMRKVGDEDFVFPVGKGSIYAPIGIYNVPAGGELANNIFVAEYMRNNPQGTPYGTAPAPSLDHVSFVEYWTLRQTSGSAFKKVSLAVNLTSFCQNLSRTYVSHWTSLWTNEGSTITDGPYITGINETGTIISNNNITGFNVANNAFTLATDLPFASNPLPIDLITFDASKLTTTKALVNWELATISSPSAKFEIQKADATKHFSSIGTINGNSTDRFYSFHDNDLKKGINYYRLKMTDEGGKISYSRTVAVMNDVSGVVLTSLVPTVVNNSAILTIVSSGRQQVVLVIVDMQGRVVQKQNQAVPPGNTTIQISTDRLPAGVYQLLGVTPEGKTNTVRFIKQ